MLRDVVFFKSSQNNFISFTYEVQVPEVEQFHKKIFIKEIFNIEKSKIKYLSELSEIIERNGKEKLLNNEYDNKNPLNSKSYTLSRIICRGNFNSNWHCSIVI